MGRRDHPSVRAVRGGWLVVSRPMRSSRTGQSWPRLLTIAVLAAGGSVSTALADGHGPARGAGRVAPTRLADLRVVSLEARQDMVMAGSSVLVRITLANSGR